MSFVNKLTIILLVLSFISFLVTMYIYYLNRDSIDIMTQIDKVYEDLVRDPNDPSQQKPKKPDKISETTNYAYIDPDRLVDVSK